MALREQDLCRVRALQASVRKAWFVVNRFSSGQGRPAPEALRDRARHIRAVRANSVVVRIQQVLLVRVAIRRVPEWVE
jgi:hypothetical protein